jgi:hypothetical protein
MATTAPATPAAATPKPKTVLEDMDSRRMFDSTTEAAAYLNSMASTLSDFGEGHDIIGKGVALELPAGATEGDDSQPVWTFDPATYTSDMRVMIAVLTARVPGAQSKVAAIVITPAPTLASILADEAGKSWLAKIVDKELNHVAVRPLRNPKEGESLDDLAEQMPTTLAGYVTTTREGGILDTFNELARGIIETFAKQVKPWEKARLTKPELRAAMSSRAYASEYYPLLEDRGQSKKGDDLPSFFVLALTYGKQVAAVKGLDPAIFDKWLATRNEATLTTKAEGDDDDADDIDLESLVFIDPSEKKAAAPATPATDPAPAIEGAKA